MRAETIPGPEYWLMDRETMAKLEKEDQDKERLMERARGFWMTALTVKALQSLAWSAGGSVGYLVAGRLTAFGISAISNGIENASGIPLSQITVNIPPEYSTSLHQAINEQLVHVGLDGIFNGALYGVGEAANQIFANVQRTVLVFTSGTTAALYGFNTAGRYSANKISVLGDKLGTSASLQGLKLLSRLPNSRMTSFKQE